MKSSKPFELALTREIGQVKNKERQKDGGKRKVASGHRHGEQISPVAAHGPRGTSGKNIDHL